VERKRLDLIAVHYLERLGVYNGNGAIDNIRNVDHLGHIGQRLFYLGSHRRGVDVLLGLLFRRLFRGVLLLFPFSRLLGRGAFLLLLEFGFLVGSLLLFSERGEIGEPLERALPVGGVRHEEIGGERRHEE
jgi:hypothetical protein